MHRGAGEGAKEGVTRSPLADGARSAPYAPSAADLRACNERWHTVGVCKRATEQAGRGDAREEGVMSPLRCVRQAFALCQVVCSSN